MTLTTVQTEPLTLEAFVHLYATEGPFEIINEERIMLMPPVYIHVLVIKRLMAVFMEHEKTYSHGEAFSEAPFVLVDEAGWVKGSRVPGVMYFSAERLRTYREQTPDFQEKPFILVPDLAVEVVSPNDSYTDIQRKVEGYLADGVHLVWVIDPQRRKVIVHQGITQITFSEKDILAGSDVIPDLVISVGSLFEE